MSMPLLLSGLLAAVGLNSAFDKNRKQMIAEKQQNNLQAQQSLEQITKLQIEGQDNIYAKGIMSNLSLGSSTINQELKNLANKASEASKAVIDQQYSNNKNIMNAHKGSQFLSSIIDLPAVKAIQDQSMQKLYENSQYFLAAKAKKKDEEETNSKPKIV